MRLRDFTAVAASLAISAGACGGKTASSDAIPVAHDDFPLAVAHALCDSIGGCCTHSSLAYDEAACVKAGRAHVEGYLAWSAAQGGTYDPEVGGACVRATHDYAAQCSDPAANPEPRRAACAHLFVGKKQPGEACTALNDCARSAEGEVRCVDGLDGKICQVRKRVSGGERCGVVKGTPPAVVGACEFGESDAFACVGDPGVCVARIPVGGDCRSTDACVPSAACNGKCVPRVGAGGSCFDSNSCNDGATCTNGRCIANLPDGAPCKDASECAGGYCSVTCTSSDFVRANVCAGLPD